MRTSCSTDAGDAALEGDWALERHLGTIDSASLFSEADPRRWTGTLDEDQVRPDFLSTELTFEANAGQLDAAVDFLARGSGYAVFLSETDAIIRLSEGDQTFALRLDIVGQQIKTQVINLGHGPRRLRRRAL